MKQKLLLIAVVAFMVAANVRADSFLTRNDVPNAIYYLPVHPTMSDYSYFDDWSQYAWGKTVRNTARGAQAVADAVLTVEAVVSGYHGSYGMTISNANTPILYAMLVKIKGDCDNATYYAKNYYMRKRPFDHYNEPTSTPGAEASLRVNGSYPSGHTTLGWAFALVLAEINPERQDTILSRGYQFGQSRVIVGAHYQSDITAGRMVASALVARLHSDDTFNTMLKAAKEEFAKKSGK